MGTKNNTPGDSDWQPKLLDAAGRVVEHGSVLRLALACIRTGRYREAILVLEAMEDRTRINPHASPDPLLRLVTAGRGD